MDKVEASPLFFFLKKEKGGLGIGRVDPNVWFLGFMVFVVAVGYSEGQGLWHLAEEERKSEREERREREREKKVSGAVVNVLSMATLPSFVSFSSSLPLIPLRPPLPPPLIFSTTTSNLNPRRFSGLVLASSSASPFDDLSSRSSSRPIQSSKSKVSYYYSLEF